MDSKVLRSRREALHIRNCAAAAIIAESLGRPLTPEQLRLLEVRPGKMKCATHLQAAHALRQDELLTDLLAAAADALAVAKGDEDRPAIVEATPAPDLEFDDLTIAPDTPEKDSTIAPDHEQDAEPVSATTEGDTGPGPGELFPAATNDTPAIEPDQAREIDLAIAQATGMTKRKRR